MSKNSDIVKEWHKRTRKRMTEAFGNKCGLCGYDKCQRAFDFHHINPNEKQFGLSHAKAYSKSWMKTVEELRKCVMLCVNCHREYHDGLISESKMKTVARFDETYADYKIRPEEIKRRSNAARRTRIKRNK